MAHDHHGHDHLDHHHGHSHGHGHHGHSHAPKDFGRAFAIGAALNLMVVLAQAGVGLYSHSLALLADAGHNLSDVASLLLAWLAAEMAKKAPTLRRTYGMRKGTILASLANAALLLAAMGAITWEAVRRLAHPEAVAAGPVMIAAGIGVAVNTATALMFAKGSHGDLNARGAFLHMASDAAVSAGVIVAALVMSVTGWTWLDPVVSLAIVAIILLGTWGLLRDSLDLAMDAAPRGVDPAAVRDWLAALPGVAGVHDLHIWAMSTTETALTAHLVRPQGEDDDAFLHAACAGLSERFAIGHATLQVERGGDAECRQAAPGAI